MKGSYRFRVYPVPCTPLEKSKQWRSPAGLPVTAPLSISLRARAHTHTLTVRPNGQWSSYNSIDIYDLLIETNIYIVFCYKIIIRRVIHIDSQFSIYMPNTMIIYSLHKWFNYFLKSCQTHRIPCQMHRTTVHLEPVCYHEQSKIFEISLPRVHRSPSCNSESSRVIVDRILSYE